MPFSRVYERMYLIVCPSNNCSNASVSLITAGRDLWGLRIIEEVLRIKCRQHDTNWKANLHRSHTLGQISAILIPAWWMAEQQWKLQIALLEYYDSSMGMNFVLIFRKCHSFSIDSPLDLSNSFISFNPLEFLYYLRLVLLLFLYFSLVISKCWLVFTNLPCFFC